jgi:hypothetical protein
MREAAGHHRRHRRIRQSYDEKSRPAHVDRIAALRAYPCRVVRRPTEVGSYFQSALFKSKKTQHPAIIADHDLIVSWILEGMPWTTTRAF